MNMYKNLVGLVMERKEKEGGEEGKTIVRKRRSRRVRTNCLVDKFSFRLDPATVQNVIYILRQAELMEVPIFNPRNPEKTTKSELMRLFIVAACEAFNMFNSSTIAKLIEKARIKLLKMKGKAI